MTTQPEGQITEVTRGPADLIAPHAAPADQIQRYGIAMPFQIGPRTAALCANLRRLHVPCIDFEAGTDLIAFDALDSIRAERAVPLTRNEAGADTATGKPLVLVKHMFTNGFVPLGALLPDGRPHPHAGTGFALGRISEYAADFSQRTREERTDTLPWYEQNPVMTMELAQIAYDGRTLRVESSIKVPSAELLDGWHVSCYALRMGVPDGDDLLAPMSACRRAGDPLRTGVGRWARGRGAWRPVAFTPVSDDRWMEGTLVRDVDDSLLLCARCGPHNLGDTASFGIGVWQSRDGGESWRRVVTAARVRATTPVTMHQALDGTPYVTANPWREACFNSRGVRMGIWSHRQQLALWPLDDARTGLGAPLVVRDSDSEFDPPSETGVWCIDHGIDGTVRLADGAWRNLLTYRIREHKGARGEVEEPSTHTGLYIEEVRSAGTPRPAWRF